MNDRNEHNLYIYRISKNHILLSYLNIEILSNIIYIQSIELTFIPHNLLFDEEKRQERNGILPDLPDIHNPNSKAHGDTRINAKNSPLF